MSNKPKILIIKLGHSETLDPDISSTTSLGDVLRTTVILSNFKDDHVSWLVDMEAYRLLEGNKYIDRILPFNLQTILQLKSERFDTVINLEKVPGICALADSINAWRRYGFRFNELNGSAEAHDGADEVMAMCRSRQAKRDANSSWQEIIFKMIGKEWNGEEYLLHYDPKPGKRHDIGFNWAVGKKWPYKAWPKNKWEELEGKLKDKYSISWQKGMENLHDYMDWIASCDLLVTNDSLGTHIALAMKKQVVVLYGPTSPNEVHLYDRGIAVKSGAYDCIPCLTQDCDKDIPCMDLIETGDVLSSVEKLKNNG